jgi:putative transposase
MKRTYSVSEIASALGISDRSVRRKAANEGWKAESYHRKGGRGRETAYLADSIPADDLRAIEYNRLSANAALVPKQPVAPDQVHPLSGAPEPSTDDANKKRAQARLEILNAFNSFTKDQSLKITEAEQAFCNLYSKRRLNIPLWVHEIEKSLSLSKLRRLKSLHKKQGFQGLITKYGQNRSQRAITPEMQILIAGQLSERPGMKPINIYRILRKTFPDCPNQSTVYRYVNVWKREYKELVALQENPSRWKNKYQAAHGDMAADVPSFGHTWEMDSTPADVITSDGQRATIIGAIDVYSRRAVAVVSPSSKSVAVAQCIRKGLLAWGVPKRIRKDNGKDYSSYHIEAVTSSLQIETPKLPPYKGEAKPFIERWFWTLSRQLFEVLPGYCGHSVADRQAIRDRQTWGQRVMKQGKPVRLPLTARELQAVIDKWIEQDYERQRHRGINDTPLGRAKQSPVWPTRIRDERTLDMLLAPVATRVVQKKGINLEGGWYTANELIGCVGEKVMLRRDESDAGKIYVFRAKGGVFICIATDEALTGERLSSYLAARREHGRRMREKVRALQTLSKTTTDPYTVLMETGKIEEQAGKVVHLQPEASTPAIRETKKAFTEPKKEMGLADEFGEPEPERAGPVVDIEEKRAEVEARDRWAEPPEDLYGQPAILYDWYLKKQEVVGLTAADQEYMEYLLATFPSITGYLSDMEKLRGGAALRKAAPEQQHIL